MDSVVIDPNKESGAAMSPGVDGVLRRAVGEAELHQPVVQLRISGSPSRRR
jgi:hypothetical protein